MLSSRSRVMILRNLTRNLFRPSSRYSDSKPADIILCLDIECTCDSPVQIAPMEIIEIACLKLDIKTSETQGTGPPAGMQGSTRDTARPPLIQRPSFHSFVKPVINPELTLFCQELTGVTQSTVDRSDTIDHVIERLFSWMQEQKLIDMNNRCSENFAFASCGNFDMNILAPIMKRHKFEGETEFPIYLREWINVKKSFVNHKKEWPKGLYHMLEILGHQPTGRLHSAFDDCINLAKVVEGLQSEGYKLRITNRAS